MVVVIDGWQLSNAKGAEVQAAIAEVQGLEVDDVNAAYVRNWMANHVRQVVADRRRRVAAVVNPPSDSDPMS